MQIRKFAKLGNKLRMFNGGLHNQDDCVVVVVCDKLKSSDYMDNKSDSTFFKLGSVINNTKANNGQQMVLYSDGKDFYVRECKEFNKKFTKI